VLASDANGESPEALSFSQASDIVELVVLTADDTFLQMLRDAVGAARRVWHVPTADKVSDLLVAGQVGILVLDAQALQGAASVFVSQISRQFPDLVVVVAGNRDAEASLASLISAGIVYRFIHKPMSPARAKLFAEAAVRKYDEQRKRAVAPPRSVPAVAAGVPRLWLGIGGALVLAAVIAVIALLRLTPRDTVQPALVERAPVGGAAAQEPARDLANAPPQISRGEAQERLLVRAENALIEERLDEAAAGIEAARKAGVDGGRIAFLSSQLAKARERRRAAAAQVHLKDTTQPQTPDLDVRLSQALGLAAERTQSGHLIEPDRDNAKYFVQQALDIDPNSSPTQSAEQALALALLSQARGAIERRDFAHAVSLLDAANGVASPANVDTLLEMLRKARKQAEAESWTQLLKTGQERLQQDRLIEPANDNAKYYLLTLRSVDPGNAGLGAALQDLGSRLVAKARRALDLRELDAARRWLDEATDLGFTSADLGTTRSDWQAASARQAFLNDVVAADRLKLVKSVPPIYPRKAEQAKIEGWVELDFTVTETGEVKDLDVHASNPPGVFEGAALSALAQWRYQPIMRDAKPAAQRARIRIRFSMQN
jgi:TonB family protein